MLSRFFCAKKHPDISENVDTIFVLLQHCRLCFSLKRPKNPPNFEVKNIVLADLSQILQKIVEVNRKTWLELCRISEVKERNALKKAEKQKKHKESWKDVFSVNPECSPFPLEI